MQEIDACCSLYQHQLVMAFQLICMYCGKLGVWVRCQQGIELCVNITCEAL